MRLLIGEGNFSFALALINKHDAKAHHSPEKSLAHSIIATEFKNEDPCQDCEMESVFANEFPEKLSLKAESKDTEKSEQQPILCDTCRRVALLTKKGVQIERGVDGTKIHEIEKFHNKTFSRIHWNCPHDGSRFESQTLPKIIEKFFKSCRKMQNEKDRVHITLAQPPDIKAFYQGVIYNIAQAASLAGYTLIKKRKFDHSRYPEYQHVKTSTNSKAPVTDKGMREFIFQKVNDESFKKAVKASKTIESKSSTKIFTEILTEKLKKYSDKKYTLRTELFDHQLTTIFHCSSDDDSSDYESKD
jgi:hypothetical protein